MTNQEIANLSTTLIPTTIGELGGETQPLVSAHDLHAFLEIETRFDTWVSRRIEEYKFAETLDFTVTLKNERLDRGIFGFKDVAVKNYHLSLDMAKELSMVERNDKGRQARRYFIECEKAVSHATPKVAELIAQNHALKTEILKAMPDFNAIKIMYDGGLANWQIKMAINVSRSTVEKRLRTMRKLGLVNERGNQAPSKQLALALGKEV